jgi:subtilisin family serine protease
MKTIVLVCALLCLVLCAKISEENRRKWQNEKLHDVIVVFPTLDVKNLQVNGVRPSEMSWTQQGEIVVSHLVEHRAKTQAAVLGLLTGRGIKHQSFYITNVISIKQASWELIEELAAREDVEAVAENAEFKLIEPKTKQSVARSVEKIEWNIVQVKAPQVWAKGVKGKGITIAVVDSGEKYDHEALVNQYRGNNGGSFDHEYNWYDAMPPKSKVPVDALGHGSHCTGTVLGATNSSYHIGVAPEANWIGCRVFIQSSTTYEIILKCLEWTLAPTDFNFQNPKPEKRPHVSSHSYGGGASGAIEQNFQKAVDALSTAGVAFIAAAGNSGSGCNSASSIPQRLTGVVSIGAVDNTKTIARFSSRGFGTTGGKKLVLPHITTPGVNIVSSMPNGGYSQMSGTSMATPNAAGSFALLWSGLPSLKGKIQQTLKLLEETADHKVDKACGAPQDTPNNVYGSGNIDLEKAYTKGKGMGF